MNQNYYVRVVVSVCFLLCNKTVCVSMFLVEDGGRGRENKARYSADIEYMMRQAKNRDLQVPTLCIQGFHHLHWSQKKLSI